MLIIRSRSIKAEIRRNADRRSLQLPARIDTGSRGILNCTIDKFSEDGARLIFLAGTRLPRTFVLLLTENGQLCRGCRLVWHDGLEAGVAFSGKPSRLPLGLTIVNV